MVVGWLSLVRTRVFRNQQLDGVGGFHAALLLKLSNPIGYGLNHFARRLSRRDFFGSGFLLARPLVLLDDSDYFLF